MNKYSLLSFAFGLLAVLNLLLMLFYVNMSFLGLSGTIVFYLPLLGIIFGVISFFQNPTKNETLLSILGIIFVIALYSYWIYLFIILARGMAEF